MEEALKRFYESRENRLVSRGISDQHCMTPDYIVDDILRSCCFELRCRQV